MKVVGLLDDRSVLSTEMEDLCTNLPIYVVVRRAMSPNDEEVDVESDEDVDEVLDEEARDFLEITNLHDTPSARKSYRIGCVSVRVRCRSKASSGTCLGQLFFFFSLTK